MRFALFLGALLSGGCAHCKQKSFWETVAFSSPAQLYDRLAKGDDIRVTTREDKVYRFTVSGYEPDALLGWGEDRRKYRIPHAWLTRVEVHRVESQRDPFCSYVPPPSPLSPHSTSP